MRRIGGAHILAVARVNLSVPVVILETKVSGLGIGLDDLAVRVMLVDLCLVLEKAGAMDDVNGSHRLSGLGLEYPRDGTPGSAHLPGRFIAVLVHDTRRNDPVPVIGVVSVQEVGEVLADPVFPGKRHFDTGVADFAQVLHGSAPADGGRPTRGRCLQQVEGAFVIIVRRDGKPVLEKIDVHACVPLLGGFPGKRLVHRSSGVGPLPPDRIQGGPVDGCFRLEPPAGHRHVLALVVHGYGPQVADTAPGCPDFEQVQDVVFGEERFVGNLPGRRNGGEITVLMPLGKTSGIIPPERCSYEIPVIITVTGATHERDVRIIADITV